MSSRDELQSRLEFRRSALEEARKAYLALLSGQVKSYEIGSRALTRLDLPELKKTVNELEKEVDALEGALCGRKPRRAVGVIPRDF